MKIYGISGLGADKRIYQYLTLKCQLIPIDWIVPKKKESIEAYSARLAAQINTNEAFAILGVSFGGLVAVELSKIVKPDLTILVSSAETNKELRTLYRLIGKLKIVPLVPTFLFNPPRVIANWLFGTQQKKLLNEILDDTDLSFAKWSINVLVNWKNKEKVTNPTLKIGGTQDKLIPQKKSNNVRLLEQGAHFMIVDRADEVSNMINEKIRCFEPN